MRMTTLISALLYAAAMVGANPALAQSVDTAEREAILAMREGNMRKMKIHKQALPAAQAVFFDEAG